MRISDWSSDVCSSDLAEPADRDALRLAARQALRPAPQKMANAQKLRRFVEAHPAVRRQREIEPINQVRADAAMREEPAVLKNIDDAARLGPPIGRDRTRVV